MWRWHAHGWNHERELFAATIRRQLPDHVKHITIADFNYDGVEDYLVVSAKDETHLLIQSESSGTYARVEIIQSFGDKLTSQPLLISLDMKTALLFQNGSGTFLYMSDSGV
jgi:hypothetical protein